MAGPARARKCQIGYFAGPAARVASVSSCTTSWLVRSRGRRLRAPGTGLAPDESDPARWTSPTRPPMRRRSAARARVAARRPIHSCGSSVGRGDACARRQSLAAIGTARRRWPARWSAVGRRDACLADRLCLAAGPGDWRGPAVAGQKHLRLPCRQRLADGSYLSVFSPARHGGRHRDEHTLPGDAEDLPGGDVDWTRRRRAGRALSRALGD